MEKWVESSGYRVCIAHDAAPILEATLEVKLQDLARDHDFMYMMTTWVLNLPDNLYWEGIKKQTTGRNQRAKKGRQGRRR